MARTRTRTAQPLVVVVVVVLSLWIAAATASALQTPRGTGRPARPVGLGDLEPPKEKNLLLTKLVVLNRHGHRAPNAPYWQYCPNDIKNRRRYVVDAEDLTPLGMEEEYGFGQYLRETYRDFIGDRFNRTLHFFRAVGEPRILQSAMAVAQGVFPDGFGPGGFIPHRPQFVPIFSDMETHEYLLDSVPCFGRATRDVNAWINSSFAELLADPIVRSTISYMQTLCGKIKGPKPPLFAYIKTVADGITFNTDLGLKIAGQHLPVRKLFQIRNLSTTLLMRRVYNTDEQQTYTAVDLPRRLIQLFQHRHIASSPQERNDYHNLRQTSDFFFAHRESLYAVAQFFGFSLKVPGLPEGEVPVASAIIFEQFTDKSFREAKEGSEQNIDDFLIRKNDATTNPTQNRDDFEGKGIEEINATAVSSKRGRSYVKLTLWTPYDGKHTLLVPGCANPYLCEVEELHQIYQTRILRTGTWEELCNFTKVELDKNTDIR